MKWNLSTLISSVRGTARRAATLTLALTLTAALAVPAGAEQTAQPEAEASARQSAVVLEEENGPVESGSPWQQMTGELAEEDPMADRYEHPAAQQSEPETEALTDEELAQQLAELTMDEDGTVWMTPEQIEQALSSQYADPQLLGLENSTQAKGFFQWLLEWLFGIDLTPQYSGWRTEWGKTYYYDPSTHKKVTGIRTIDGKIYYFDANGVKQNATFGVDVSKYQTSVDWKKVKAAGAEFAIIRIGYRGYETGTLVLDPMFETHFAGAKAAGLRVGVYIFSQAINEDEAREEAFACAYVLNGRKLDYPIYFDSEYATSSRKGRADNLSRDVRTACAVAFCEEVKKNGYEPGVYASTSWFGDKLNMSALAGYSIWNAHYGVSSSKIACDLWQGSCEGVIDGVKGQIDLNISYRG